MRLTVHPLPPIPGGFRALDADRSSFSDYFGGIIRADPRIKGRVLDVGCGKEPSRVPGYTRAFHECGTVDGVDPSPAVAANTFIRSRWCATLEEAVAEGDANSGPIPAGAYDAIISIFVAEHVDDPPGFLRAAHKVLRPGGVMYACTPNRTHPFAQLVLLAQATGLKARMAKADPEQGINDYPAHYRLNNPRAITRAAGVAGFASADIYPYPCVNWDHYFPRRLRFLPNAFDRIFAPRSGRFAQQIMFKLEKA